MTTETAPATWPERDCTRVVGVVVALFLTRAALAAVIVPPWQGPDEPAHFVLARQAGAASEARDALAADLQPRVLRSMAAHRWWEFYGEPTPSPLPTQFDQVPAHLAAGTLAQPAYYFLAAAALRLVPASDIEVQYRALRWLSIALAAGALLAGWAGTRILWGDWVATGTVAVVALHPQFLLSGISVNPDVLITACGAFVWWHAARVLTMNGRSRAISVVLMFAASIVAVLSKRNGIPLVIVALLATFMIPRRRGLASIATPVVVLALFSVTVAVLWQFDAFRRLTTFWSYSLTMRRSIDTFTIDGVTSFLLTAMDMSWLYAGWLQFPAPSPWLWVARSLTIGALVGGVALLVKRGWQNRALLLPCLFVAVHVGALLAVTFISRASPQGRYFFAVLFPAALVLWIAVVHWFPPVRRPVAGAALLAIIAALDATGFLLVLLPVYAS